MLEYNINLEGKTVLVTGMAGFIGGRLAARLLEDFAGVKVIGVDSLNAYYDARLKYARLAGLGFTPEIIPGDSGSGSDTGSDTGSAESRNGISPFAEGKEYRSVKYPGRCMFLKMDIADKSGIDGLFSAYDIDIVVNLAAQAGVRGSISDPDAYVASNITGFYNILEACRHHKVGHLVYASSSSVYGGNVKIPYSTDDKTDSPLSLYAATKKSGELLAHAYSKLYDIPSTGLRFFTVYGPAGRPDMAYFSFTDSLVGGGKIRIFNYGNCLRDFTYIDDIVEGVVRVMRHAPERRVGEDGLPVPPYKIYNIGNSHPENLLDFVDILQSELVRAGALPRDYDFAAHRELVPMQPGDVPVTYADTAPLEEDFGFRPSTPLREGLRKFAEWYAGRRGTAVEASGDK